MPKLVLLATLSVMWFYNATLCSADVFDVYIAAGQSNMDGRGNVNELTGSLAPYKNPQPDVLIHYTNPGNSNGTNAYQSGWTVLAPGLAVPPNYTAPLPSNRFGPELSFGKEMAAGTTERRVAIIKVTRGSTSLENDWDPSDGINGPKGHMYAGFENAVAQALQSLQALGHSGDGLKNSVEIRGMIWHQGEADNSSLQYEANLTEFVNLVRQDLGYANLPFLIGELESVPNSEDRTVVRNAQIAVAAAMDFVEFIPSDGLAVQDAHHFTSAGVITLGERFAATMLEMNSKIVPGDFNRDGVVNYADYEVWNAFQGSITDARADGNNDGIVDHADLRIWQAAVPEPSAGSLIIIGVIIGIGYVWLKPFTCSQSHAKA